MKLHDRHLQAIHISSGRPEQQAAPDLISSSTKNFAMNRKQMSRRDFFQTAALASGSAVLQSSSIKHKQMVNIPAISNSPREIWIAGFSLMGLEAATPELQSGQVIDELKNLSAFKPDILCLPETFPFMNVEKRTTPAEKVAISAKVLERFSAFAKLHHCYTICPVYVSEKGKVYNAAVVMDRNGARIGDYKKIRVTDYEIASGITPGPLDPPVFQTDFGVIGIQICWDIAWDEGWKRLRKKGAEIIFWPSAFAGGQMINTMAWQNKCVVVSCTVKNTSKICDISGEAIVQTGKWNPNLFCSPVNLEKAFVHTWPYVEHFDAIRNKYGRKVRITTFHEEEWSIFESLSPEVRISEVLNDYHIKTYEQYIEDTALAEQAVRPV